MGSAEIHALTFSAALAIFSGKFTAKQSICFSWPTYQTQFKTVNLVREGTTRMNAGLCGRILHMKTALPLQVLMALLLLLAAPCFGTELPQSFAAKEGFTLHLPSDWKPIPKEVLDKYSLAIAKMAPQAEKQVYDYGFQRNDAPKWFSYPYILVQVKRSGRIPEEQLKALKRIEKAMDESFTKTTDSLSAITSNASLGEPIYDPASHILWTRIAIDIKNTGTVRGMIGTVLTEAGFVQIAGYAKDDDFGIYLPIFESVIATTEIRADLKYGSGTMAEKTAPEEAEPGTVPWKAMTVAVIVILLAFLVWKIRKKGTGAS